MAALVYDQDGGRPVRPGTDSCLSRPTGSQRRVSLATEWGTRRQPGHPLVAAVALLVLVLAGGSIVDVVAGVVSRHAPVARAAPVHAVATAEVEDGGYLVRPGQTYWSIAEALPGSGDIRARVDALQAANDGKVLHAGDRLVVPPG
jgi:hypothetical protein